MSHLYVHADYPAALSAFNNSTGERKWSKFKSVHLEVAKHKCPICECSLKQDELLERASNNGVVTIKATMDHYRPKDESLYPFLKYEHTNYILMCSDCNQAYKGNLFPLHNSTPNRVTSVENLAAENPLIVNPISDDLLGLFHLVFRYTQSGRKVLELKADSTDAYLKEKAEETIKVFNLGDCEVNVNENSNVHTCRIGLLNDHFKKFYGFIEALKNRALSETKDEEKIHIEKAISEINKYSLKSYGFYEFIKKSQYKNLVS